MTISSNEKGDPTVFELSVNLNYEIYNENSLLNKNIIQKKITYNNIKDKFELLKYEENIIKSLSENISDEILRSISSL